MRQQREAEVQHTAADEDDNEDEDEGGGCQGELGACSCVVSLVEQQQCVCCFHAVSL